MSLLEDKALRVNLITMVILVITAIYDFMLEVEKSFLDRLNGSYFMDSVFLFIKKTF